MQELHISVQMTRKKPKIANKLGNLSVNWSKIQYFWSTIHSLQHLSTCQMQQSRQLESIFQNYKNLRAFVDCHLSNDAFMQQFTDIFPKQLTILSDYRQEPQICFGFFSRLIKKQRHSIIVRETLHEAMGILERYGKSIQLDTNQHEQTFQLQFLQKEPISNSSIVHNSGLRMAIHLSDNPNDILETMALNDVVYSTFNNLMENTRRFSILFRYSMSLLTQQWKLQAKMLWFQQIESQFLGYTTESTYTNNVKTIFKFLRTIFMLPNKKPKIEKLKQLHDAWSVLLTKFFCMFVDVDVCGNMMREFESKRNILCLSGQILQNVMNVTFMEEINKNSFFIWSTVDVVSSRYDTPKSQPNKKSRFIQIEHQSGWLDILRLAMQDGTKTNDHTTKLILQEECLRIYTMLRQIENECFLMEYRAHEYCQFLRMQCSFLSKSVNYLKQLENQLSVDEHWTKLIIQEHLTLVIQQNVIYFSSKEDSKGCLVDTLNNFIQYFTHSNRVTQMVQNGNKLKELNEIYCDYMGLVKSRLKSQGYSEDIFQIVRKRVDECLFYSWRIASGPSTKDQQAYRSTQKMKLSLNDLELRQFSADQQFYLSLCKSQFEQLVRLSSPSMILDCILSMKNKIQCSMKLSQPKYIFAGDAQLSIVYFLMARNQIKNLDSLISFIKICWFNQHDYGQSEYLMTILQSVLQIILQHK